METSVFHPLVLDLALYGFFGFFGCLAFMSWYLKRTSHILKKQPNRGFMWIETLFRFRDFTRVHFRKVHTVYYLAILLLFSITAIFCAGITLHGLSQPAPFNSLIGIMGPIVFAILLALFWHLAKKSYYTEEN